MFGNDTVVPGDDAQIGPATSVPVVPRLRVFRVTRFKASDGNRSPWETITETITVLAHDIEMNAAGNILRFIEYYNGPEGPSRRVVKAFNGFLDYEEDMPEMPRIIGVTGSNLQ